MGYGLSEVMDLAVHFNHEFRGWAVEVGNVGPDRMLLSESNALRRSSQSVPQPDFGRTHGALLLASETHRFSRSPHGPSTTQSLLQGPPPHELCSQGGEVKLLP